MGRKIRISENIGLNLKQFRTTYRVKSKEIAELLGKSAAYVSKLEKGQIYQIEKSELVKITNYISKSEEGYYLFCEKIAEEANAEELDQNMMLMNFDLVDRVIPVTPELVSFIKDKMVELQISSDELAVYINKNEDLDESFLKEHKIDPTVVEKNVWLPYQEADSLEYPHCYILAEVKKERIEAFINGNIYKCEYMFPYIIMYHLVKLRCKKENKILNDKTIIECKLEAEETLLKYKFYSLSVKARYNSQSNSEEEQKKILSQFDIDNMEYISYILEKISFLSQYDVSYTNNKLKAIVDNMEKNDPSFVLAYMAISLSGIDKLQTSIKKKFLQEIVELVEKYVAMAETGENLERY